MNQEETFASRLIRAREGAVLTQEELAEMSDITQTQISRYERGAAMPRPGTLRMLATALGVEPEWLAKGEGRAKQMRISLDSPEPGQLGLSLRTDPVTRDHFLSLAAEAGVSPELFLARLMQEHMEKLANSMTPDKPFGQTPDSEWMRVLKRLEELEARLDRAIPRSTDDEKTVQVVSLSTGKPKP